MLRVHGLCPIGLCIPSSCAARGGSVHGVTVVPSFPAVWLSMNYSPSLSLYFIVCNVNPIIVFPNFIIVKNK